MLSGSKKNNSWREICIAAGERSIHPEGGRMKWNVGDKCYLLHGCLMIPVTITRVHDEDFVNVIREKDGLSFTMRPTCLLYDRSEAIRWLQNQIEDHKEQLEELLTDSHSHA